MRTAPGRPGNGGVYHCKFSGKVRPRDPAGRSQRAAGSTHAFAETVVKAGSWRPPASGQAVLLPWPRPAMHKPGPLHGSGGEVQRVAGRAQQPAAEPDAVNREPVRHAGVTGGSAGLVAGCAWIPEQPPDRAASPAWRARPGECLADVVIQQLGAALPETARLATTRSGASYWLTSLRWMMRFELGRARQWAAMMMVIQVMMGAGMALMYGFSYPHLTPSIALYIATETPTTALIRLGFVLIRPASASRSWRGPSTSPGRCRFPAAPRQPRPSCCTRCWPCPGWC
jgi:hypothetical protein